MTQENRERLRVEPFRQAGRCIAALMSDLPRKNGWTIAEHAGDATPDRTQRLLNHAVWDTGVNTVYCSYVAGHLADELVVGALDESASRSRAVRRRG